MINVPIAAETVFTIGTFPVTNTQINATVALLIFFVLAIVVRIGLKERPGKIQNFIETALEWVLGYFDQVTRSREKSKKFLPLVGTLFFFILVSNWMSLLPGTGSIGLMHGTEWIPLFRPATSDLNLTLAMAIVSVISAHAVGIGTVGLWKHINKFIQIGGLWKSIKKFNPIAILTALIEFVVGLIELVGEFAKIASLSLRLFGNVFAGEVLMTVMASLFAFFLPLPFMALELIVGIVQATVFSLLTLVYLTVLSMPPHGEGHEHKEHKAGGELESKAELAETTA
ncbi:MAG TPA: F0F1 ATP synthase subunit A [Patescibacteria group bacterium]|nr:F0F1 ATP synthase subunit A [Patescibacteria group bacterium]